MSDKSGPGIALRTATAADVPRILRHIRALGDYERLAHEVVATEAQLAATLFGERRHAEVTLADLEGRPAGFALYFHNYSTFLGMPGLYLEDLYVEPAARKHGVGRALLRHLAQLALERGCGRLEWAALDWNRLAIDFYMGLGAVAMDDWTTFRLTGPALQVLAR
jgi:GNAT superfamily N-acetyltransferase